MIDIFVSKWAISSKSLNIIPWIKKKLVRTKLEIFAAKIIQIGFDNYGPIIKLNLAFLSKNQDLVIKDFSIVLKHEDGKTKTFEWEHLTQPLFNENINNNRYEVLLEGIFCFSDQLEAKKY